MRRVPAVERASRVAAALEMVRLRGLEDRYPRELSGGQQQRVAVARAIVIRPSVLLLDEPLSNLDARLRQTMREELRELQRTLRIDTILVTHDQDEALSLADRIAVMQRGRVEQVGSPEAIYERPASPFVAEFMGHRNLIDGQVLAPGGARPVFRTDHGLTIPLSAGAAAHGRRGTLALWTTAIALLGPDAVSLGGSEYLWALHGRLAGRLAPLDLQVERRVQSATQAAVAAGLVTANVLAPRVRDRRSSVSRRP